MSVSRSEQQANGSRLGSFVVNSSSSTTSKKHHHQRSSLVTTTTSSSGSARAQTRLPITSFHSIGSSNSSFSSAWDDSPLNDLRERLAAHDRRLGGRMMFASRLQRGPQSAPATLSQPSYKRVVEEEHNSSDKEPADCPETSATIILNVTQESNPEHHHTKQHRQLPPISQVGEVAQHEEAPDQQQQQQQSEPIVEVKQTSSSGSSSASSSPSAASSAVSSPVSSRQSSDCQAKQLQPNSKDKQLAPVGNSGAGLLAVTSSPTLHQDSDSSDSSSPRTLVRRRTVRRVRHHRQELEESEVAHRPGSRVVTTTYTTATQKKSPERTQRNPREGSPEGNTKTQANDRLAPESESCRLSTSKSSSKIATVTSSTSSSSTSHSKHHHQKKSSSHTTSKQQVVSSNSSQRSQKQQHQEEASSSKLDLNNCSSSTMGEQQHQSLFERRNRSSATDIERRSRLGTATADEVAAQEALQHRSESTSSSSFNASSSLHQQSSSKMLNRHIADGSAAAATVSSSASSSCETSLARSATSKKTLSTTAVGATLPHRQLCELEKRACDLSTSSSSHFKSSSSSAEVFRSARAAALASQQRSFLGRSALDRNGGPPSQLLFLSPDVESLAQEIGTDFAELENSTSLMIREQHATRSVNGLTSRLFGTGSMQTPRITHQSYAPLTLCHGDSSTLDSLIQETNSTIRELEDNPPSRSSPTRGQNTLHSVGSSSSPVSHSQSSSKIRELLDKAQRHGSGSDASALASSETTTATTYTCRLPIGVDEQRPSSPQSGGRLSPVPLNESDRCKAVMNESIERIDQRMSDLCRKLESCNDTQKAIDLLKIMIQMIEKAWSVPVCGDDLGFKLCNSLRISGGLAIILGFIHDRLLLETSSKSRDVVTDELQSNEADRSRQNTSKAPQQDTPTRANNIQQAPAAAKLLKLNLSKVHSQQQLQERHEANADQSQINNTKDDDSDILTSDLGLDSVSVESLSYVSAHAGGSQPKAIPAAESAADANQKVEVKATTGLQGDTDEEDLRRVRKEELVFLSAHLLSQCLTSDNRDYIVKYGLDPVIKLACNFTTMKSNQSKRLLKRSALMRQGSTMKQQQLHQQQDQLEAASQVEDSHQQETTNMIGAAAIEPDMSKTTGAVQELERSDMHSAIGTEILQHLFKHSEETCSRMVALGALQATLYGCRSSHVETLRHCASALANLALYGGPDGQQTMIEQKAHVWLFPLAFNEDDNVQYYACLAIVVLAANQEIEADVLKSSTLDLVEPFVTLHEPRKFAESTTSHIHGQSAGWLKKLMPLLDSRREEARNLACFHFAMEAYIKREQGQTALFKEIGSLEPLRRAGSSPIAIASKFACQALRLIGEKEPHKLSQQVPLWTNEDVCEWVSQIGFESFRQTFRESHVDGDLLLQLDEEMLKFDIRIENGIIRKRFLRELSHLKRIADYSSVDKSSLGQALINSTSLLSCCCLSNQQQQLVMGSHHAGTSSSLSNASARNEARDFLQYIYPIIQLGVTRDNIHLVDCDQLLAECKITNALHRTKLANSIRELQDRIILEAASNERNSLGGGDHQKTLDVFVSYRRSTGSQLASLLKVHLQLRGFSVFIDVERLEAGKFDNNLLDSIKMAKNFILVLSPNALDRCIGDHECKDWVHKEIVAALASNCNIIPIIDNFHWPDPEQLPEDMRSISYFNGVRWIHDYQDACVDKVERFIRGELSNSSMLGTGGPLGAAAGQATTGSSTMSVASGCNSSVQTAHCPHQSRLGGVSTPSIVAGTPSICSGSNLGSFQSNCSQNNNNHAQATLNSSIKATHNHDHHPPNQNAPIDTQLTGQHHPLASYVNGNPYLQYSAQQLQNGNVNPNIRLR